MLHNPDHASIDGDICCHRVGFTTDTEEFWVARSRFDDMVDKILIDTGVQSYQIWLSDSAESNFRYTIYPLYKANRIGKPRPVHLEALKEHAVSKWGARFSDGMEADDALGIEQDTQHNHTVICSIDKDLKQIPGVHYNFVKEEWDHVDELRGLKEFYKQIVVGDVSDNIPGAYGMGPVKASRAIDGIPPGHPDFESACFVAVADLFRKSLVKEWKEPWTKAKEAAMWGQILLAGRLLKIRRSHKEGIWDFPCSNPMEMFQSLYTPQTVEAIDPSMEPTTQETPSGFRLLGVPMDHIEDGANLPT